MYNENTFKGTSKSPIGSSGFLQSLSHTYIVLKHYYIIHKINKIFIMSLLELIMDKHHPIRALQYRYTLIIIIIILLHLNQ